MFLNSDQQSNFCSSFDSGLTVYKKVLIREGVLKEVRLTLYQADILNIRRSYVWGWCSPGYIIYWSSTKLQWFPQNFKKVSSE